MRVTQYSISGWSSTDLGGLVVTYLSAGAKGPGFNPNAPAHLRLYSGVSTLVDKQCCGEGG